MIVVFKSIGMVVVFKYRPFSPSGRSFRSFDVLNVDQNEDPLLSRSSSSTKNTAAQKLDPRREIKADIRKQCEQRGWGCYGFG